jgi:hypothetical protein
LAQTAATPPSPAPAAPAAPSAGWDFLVREGAAAQFTLLGEQHGLAEIPVLTAALFEALRPSGYGKLVVETSPQGALALDRAARGGVDGVRRFLAEWPPGVAFFGQAEEAELAAFVRARTAGSLQSIWGLDYEVGSFPLLLGSLRSSAPATARPALQALSAATDAEWKKYLETRGPQHFPAFSLDPDLVRAVRRAWPRPDPAADWTLETLEQTLEINRLWVSGDNYGSNLQRNALNRANLHRYWRAEKERGRAPRALFKFGGSHVARGTNDFGNFDLGNAAFELAAAEGRESFHLLVGGALGSQSRAQFNPAELTYAPRAEKAWWGDLEPLLRPLTSDGAWIVVDLRPLRRIVHGARDVAGLPLQTLRQIDAAVLIPEATPQANL